MKDKSYFLLQGVHMQITFLDCSHCNVATEKGGKQKCRDGIEQLSHTAIELTYFLDR